MTRRRQDKREFVFLMVDLPGHPEFDGASVAAKWLYVVGLTYAGRNLTDGFISANRVVAEAEVTKKAATELVSRGRWHEPGHDCKECPQPEPGKVVIHDYLLHQRSRAEAESEREKKVAAGKKGARVRWADHLKVVPDA
jgi:hypothetical protein